MKYFLKNIVDGAAAVVVLPSKSFVSRSEQYLAISNQQAKAKNITVNQAIDAIYRDRLIGMAIMVILWIAAMVYTAANVSAVTVMETIWPLLAALATTVIVSFISSHTNKGIKLDHEH